MANATYRIDPVDVELSGVGTAGAGVISTSASAELYRGFENILYKRPAQDAMQITQRI